MNIFLIIILGGLGLEWPLTPFKLIENFTKISVDVPKIRVRDAGLSLITFNLKLVPSFTDNRLIFHKKSLEMIPINDAAVSKIQIETVPDVRFILENINTYSHQKLLEILEGIGIDAKTHAELVANLAFIVRSVSQKLDEIIKTQVAPNVQVNGIDYDLILKENDSTSKHFEPLDMELRDKLIKEQERYLNNMKRLAVLRKEAPEKIRSLSTSLVETSTFLSDSITKYPTIDLVDNGDVSEEIDIQFVSKDVNIILNQSQNSLEKLSEKLPNCISRIRRAKSIIESELETKIGGKLIDSNIPISTPIQIFSSRSSMSEREKNIERQIQITKAFLSSHRPPLDE